jgi:CDGSH-type Zn-finger protein
LGRKAKIVISKDGPYLVYGDVPLAVQVMIPDKEGLPREWKQGKSFSTEPEYKLCRCGQSRSKPFCGDECKTSKFDGAEIAGRTPYEMDTKAYEGPALMLRDSESLCAHARFCMAAGTIWHLVKESDLAQARELTVGQANHCPSGRLRVLDSKARPIEQALEKSIGVVEDLTRGCSGPLWVRGGITLESEDGTPYEERNRMALCRCGTSANKPFCDGSHRKINFDDGLLEDARKPSTA